MPCKYESSLLKVDSRCIRFLDDLLHSCALSQISMPTHFLPSFSAATHVVAHPANGSNTTSFFSDDAIIIRSYNANGFCVG